MGTDGESRAGSARLGPRAFAAAAGGVALALFVAMALIAPELPVRFDPMVYHEGAVNIACGRGYRQHWPPYDRVFGPTELRAFFPVGYSAFLAGLYALVGPGLMVPLLANAVLSALAVVLTYWLARRLAGEGVGRAATIAFLLLAATMRLSQAGYSEALFIVLLLAAFVAACARRSWASTVLAGVPLGLSALVRTTSLTAPVLFVVAFALLGDSWRRAAARAALLAVVMLAVVAPWTLRNWQVFGRFVMVSTNGGYNLWIGNNPDAVGTYRAPRTPPDVAAVRDEVEWDHRFARHATDYILKHPGAFFARMPGKLWCTLGFGLAGPQAVRAEGLPKVAARFILSLMTAVLVACTAVVGIVELVRMAREKSSSHGWAVVPLLVLGYFLAFALVFHGQRRYLYPAYPFMALALGGLWAWTAQWRHGKKGERGKWPATPPRHHP